MMGMTIIYYEGKPSFFYTKSWEWGDFEEGQSLKFANFEDFCYYWV